jgi:hypothetical protein
MFISPQIRSPFFADTKEGGDIGELREGSSERNTSLSIKVAFLMSIIDDALTWYYNQNTNAALFLLLFIYIT